jgi:hypothetical protein
MHHTNTLTEEIKRAASWFAQLHERRGAVPSEPAWVADLSSAVLTALPESLPIRDAAHRTVTVVIAKRLAQTPDATPVALAIELIPEIESAQANTAGAAAVLIALGPAIEALVSGIAARAQNVLDQPKAAGVYARTEWEPLPEAAKRLRRDLREQWPGVKFSVRSERFAGGNAINVTWTDGPADRDVYTFTRPYAYGVSSHCGDYTDYKEPELVVTEDGEIVQLMRGAKYVQTHRIVSEAHRARCIAEIEALTGDPYDPNARIGVFLWKREDGTSELRRISGSDEYAERILHQACEALPVSA